MEKSHDIEESNDKQLHSATNNTDDRIRHRVSSLFDCSLRRILQSVQLTEKACVYLPTSFKNYLVFSYGSHQHRADPRVPDVLLRYWRHLSLYYPLHHHCRHQQMLQQQHGGDDISVVSLRERSLNVAIAFIDAVKSNTMQFLRNLHLTAHYTEEPELTLITKSYIDSCKTSSMSSSNSKFRLCMDVLLMRDVESLKTSLMLSRGSRLELRIRRLSLFSCTLSYVVQLISLLNHACVRSVSLSGIRLDSTQLSTLWLQLSSLQHLTSLQLSDSFIDLTPANDDLGALRALCSLLSNLPALEHLDLSGVCMTGCLYDVVTSIGSVHLTRLVLSACLLSAEDLAALHLLQQQTAVTVILN